MFLLNLVLNSSAALQVKEEAKQASLALLSINSTNSANLILNDLATFNFTTNSALFANISFLLLFLAMTIYWVNLAFFDKGLQKNQQQQQNQASLSFSAGAAEVPVSTNQAGLPLGEKDFSKNALNSSGSQSVGKGKYIILASNISLVCLLTSRWIESNHFPLSNLYESLMFLSWSCTTIYLILIYTSVKGNVFIEKLIGAILTPCALFLNAFATFSLPPEMQQAGPLVPALQSNWLMMHVTVMIISYAALILGSLLSIAFLIYNIAKFGFNGIDLKNQSSVSAGVASKNKIALNLDYLSYRIIGIGFPFLTIGILSGAVWANEAWGSYWSWDPKETWALLTWLVFAIYLHTRFTKGWEGSRPAVIAAVGFIVVWICYLGVNLLGEGLHSYGFFSGN